MPSYLVCMRCWCYSLKKLSRRRRLGSCTFLTWAQTLVLFPDAATEGSASEIYISATFNKTTLFLLPQLSAPFYRGELPKGNHPILPDLYFVYVTALAQVGGEVFFLYKINVWVVLIFFFIECCWKILFGTTYINRLFMIKLSWVWTEQR